jgi:type VI secretion system protein ImpL
MWREIRDPDFLLDALKVYRMMTGLSQMDPDFARAWWTTRLPERAPANPFPTEAAAARQLDALARMAYDESHPPPDEALVAQALEAICEIPLPRRAYNALVTDPAATALPDWIPAAHAGPNGARVLTRFSGRTLRVGIPGVYTYAGFHDVVLERLEDVAAQAALDRSVYTGGCQESAEASVTTLAEDMLKLYYDDFIDHWEGFLRDVTLAPLTDLRVASENLKDLASADSAMRRLLTAVVAETDLARPRPDDGAASGSSAGAGRLLSKLGRVGKLARQGAAFIPTGGGVAAADTSGQPVSDRFRPIRAAVEEVDGQPAGLDDAQAALAALSTMLQTVAASPSPEEALRRQGGLAELVGAVANEATRLPDPLDDWLLGIMQDWREREEEAILSQLNAIWRAEILPFCQAATAGRYPFAAGSTIDVNTADFARLFGPGGMIDGFTNEHLLRFIDANARPWRWRADLALDHGALAPFERARRIRDALFPGGAGPVMSFTLEPTDLSASAARVTINVDGQTINFAHGASRPQQMTWPGRDGTGMITLAFLPLDGGPEIMVSETGSWAFLRLIRANRLAATSLPELYSLRLSARGHHADFDLRAASVENPFDLRMFAEFQCPARI